MAFGHFFFGSESPFHGHGSWLVCEVALNLIGFCEADEIGVFTRFKVEINLVIQMVTCVFILPHDKCHEITTS